MSNFWGQTIDYQGLYDFIKPLKSSINDIVLIDNDIIAVLNYESKLSVMQLPSSTGLSMCFSYQDIDAYCKGAVDVLHYNYNLPMRRYIIDKCREYTEAIVNGRLIGMIDSMRTSYPELNSMKKSDRFRVIPISASNDLVMIIPGMYNLAAKDDASLSVYSTKQNGVILLDFTVYKHKIKSSFHVYLSQLKLS